MIFGLGSTCATGSLTRSCHLAASSNFRKWLIRTFQKSFSLKYFKKGFPRLVRWGLTEFSKSALYISISWRGSQGVVNNRLHISWSHGHITYIEVCLGETRNLRGIYNRLVALWLSVRSIYPPSSPGLGILQLSRLREVTVNCVMVVVNTGRRWQDNTGGTAKQG